MSVFVSYPTLPAINPQSPPAPGVYVRTALWTMATMFRVRHIDLFTVQSFWGGFGWLETLLPNPLVAVLITATGLALVATLGSMVRARAASDIAVVTLLLAGIAASIGLLALSIVSATPADLHGRYLIGVYLPLLVVCWSIVPRWVEGRTRAGNLVVLALSGCAVLALHIISYGIIVSRYF
jgi:hypothetical protein